MGSCAAPSAKGDDKFITTDYLQQCPSGWYKIATVVMPQATSTAVIKLYGGAGFNAGSPEQAAISELVLRAGNGS
ncbi:hypothetical protein NSX61_25250, partial [Salmonella enterica]|nr:hypothetical protein [Salmonella enterica]MCR2148727.1 hypothetical protein [Salmonella enterica]MCR2167177.1 hypothetical protein [Salmonella enterica]MCR2181033.1 hypothetical protein [Salmonella enterica]